MTPSENYCVGFLYMLFPFPKTKYELGIADFENPTDRLYYDRP